MEVIENIDSGKKTLNVSAETHARLVKITSDRGVLLYRFTDELINNALDLMEHSEGRKLRT